MLLKIITILWLIFMITLSHIPGEPSGAESRWLSSMTGVREGVLRRAAHVVLYIVLGVLTTLAWPEVNIGLRAVALAFIAVADEVTKALPVFKGRHCSVAEIGLNLLGAAGGLMLGALMIA